tara:strand:+ start:292 stop:456 length:165 start_codon:yes stop_codon:yes gene_type:complete
MDKPLIALVCLLVGMVAGSLSLIRQAEPHPKIVEKGYGLYCPDNGKFAFIGECK